MSPLARPSLTHRNPSMRTRLIRPSSRRPHQLQQKPGQPPGERIDQRGAYGRPRAALGHTACGDGVAAPTMDGYARDKAVDVRKAQRRRRGEVQVRRPGFVTNRARDRYVHAVPRTQGSEGGCAICRAACRQFDDDQPCGPGSQRHVVRLERPRSADLVQVCGGVSFPAVAAGRARTGPLRGRMHTTGLQGQYGPTSSSGGHGRIQERSAPFLRHDDMHGPQGTATRRL